ncbi:LLM class F420-dependent oxidoreductase [Mycobacterium intracellulare]|uniref:LLM class F420-dependent oxidoreductase n=1 Tax=Mycobacterium intracellulare TaxID=1767 RepID=UPI000447F9D5|nr:LLM class F420-dependent oxidoreductase [Mycobacterium intracellulare]ETZ36126.1 F420-dependent oxidoreductase family protein [Mycobacterium intracellulare MIN_061107_1834]MCA2273958.1 LLM class F420-dependent oxidoreductase [Mycobacterium intracellulare]MCA2324679.1 LLM class F420-dependent oxidoreductase [Mycobacterium intracellulare]UEB22619.1 LLM class F420-dependent oxidoreductase [Mycobacterium intracellulare]WVL05600.1 LLM class F420-dependent oxidoreductase [Mycobacterium intracellu
MSTGIILTARPDAPNLVDDIIGQARQAHDLGVAQVWLPQQQNYDAIALAAVTAAAVPGLGVGTSVVPINPRHPLIIASLAQTAQAAAHGNFSLGLGLGAREIERQTFGAAWPNTIARLREHLTILGSVFNTAAVDFQGSEFSASPTWPVQVAGGTPVPVYVAAMGPKALQVTGELADGTLPYLAGPRTIGEFIVPTITKAAADAGRPAPQIIAAVPVLLSDDVDGARTIAAERLSLYETIPSYRNVIARESIASIADLAAIGSEEAVLRQLRRYRDAGASDVVISPVDRSASADREALWGLAGAL